MHKFTHLHFCEFITSLAATRPHKTLAKLTETPKKVKKISEIPREQTEQS